MMNTRDLIFQAGAVMLIEDCRCHEDEQVAFVPLVVVTLKGIAEKGYVAEQRYFCARFRNLIGQQASDRKSVAALNQHVGIERTLVDDRARYIGPIKGEVKIVHLVTDLRFDRQRDVIVLINRWAHDQSIAKQFVLKTSEHGGGSLLIEVELRHGLVTKHLNFGLLIVGRDYPRICQKLRIRVLVKGLYRGGKLRYG